MATHLPVLIGHFLRRELRSLRLELETYPDEQLIWTLPPGLPNSAGTLILHLAGNLRHYVGAILGGNGYIRNRLVTGNVQGVGALSAAELVSARAVTTVI